MRFSAEETTLNTPNPEGISNPNSRASSEVGVLGRYTPPLNPECIYIRKPRRTTTAAPIEILDNIKSTLRLQVGIAGA